MPALRPFALIRTHDQWLRASHEHTALEGEVVQLYAPASAGKEDDKPDDIPSLQRGAGLAFDGHCRLYHSVPAEERVERLMWAAQDPLQPASSLPAPVNLFASDTDDCKCVDLSTGADVPVTHFASDTDGQLGDFTLLDKEQAALSGPQALAVTEDERLFIADSGAKRILIYDLWSNRLLRRVQLAATPVDLVATGRSVYALLASPPGLVKLEARTDPHAFTWPSEITEPARIALSPNRELFILEHAGTSEARVVRFTDPSQVIDVEFATDIEFQTGDPLLVNACGGDRQVLVVARRTGEDFLRYCLGESELASLPPLKARGYDGLGIVLAPDGRIGFWTDHGFRHVVAARLRYLPTGSVTTFRLDSGEFHTVWGRLFLDACIPKDTGIVVRCITADEPPDEPELPRLRPANTEADPPFEELSPPMPPQSFKRRLDNAFAQLLHRRETGRELPWVRPAEDDPFETYEAPVLAEPGRYLWVRIELSGNTRTTPRVKALRAEHPTHDYLRRIPQTFSRNEQIASFLRRYLATFEGVLSELEAKADARRALLDPRSAPSEILPWLASFLGLTLDERMARAPRPGGQTEDVRRTLIAEATLLFRFRGTVPGLRRFLEIYLETKPENSTAHDLESRPALPPATIVIEKFQLRGLGGAMLGDPTAVTSSAVIGAGFRVGGAIGQGGTQTLGEPIEDAFETHAHRFAVIIPASLTSEQQDVVRQILELQRPAHTLVEVCTVGAGMRVGRGLHVALTSIIGRTDGFTQLQLGNALLGRGAILGRPEAGAVMGGSRLGEDSRVG